MQIILQCPKCSRTARSEITSAAELVACDACDWSREINDAEIQNGRPTNCLVCGCRDLWRQKDFPPQLGLSVVGLGALLSIIAWQMYWPITAIGILMAFALVDLLLFRLMPDVLVCYQCGARHRRADPDEKHPLFDLETAERYRQESIRLAETDERKA